MKITGLSTLDVRFPTSQALDGSDAMNPDPDYSAAYVILETDGPHRGHGLTFTIGRGNEICVAAIEALRPLVVGLDMDWVTADMGRFWRHVTGDSQLRWLGPDKGVMHLATGAVVNAVWDLWGKVEGKPVWQLVADMSVETMARLAKHPNIVGVKDATANLARPLHTRAACGPDFCQLSGEDHTAVAFLAAGGHGCISVTANVAPRLCREMHDAWAEGRVAEAIAIQDRLLPVHDAMFCETSPGPVKYAASLLGYGSDHCRLPLAPIAEGSRGRVREAMVTAGLLN